MYDHRFFSCADGAIYRLQDATIDQFEEENPGPGINSHLLQGESKKWIVSMALNTLENTMIYQPQKLVVPRYSWTQSHLRRKAQLQSFWCKLGNSCKLIFSLILPYKLDSPLYSQCQNFANDTYIKELSFQLIHTTMFAKHLLIKTHWLVPNSNTE